MASPACGGITAAILPAPAGPVHGTPIMIINCAHRANARAETAPAATNASCWAPPTVVVCGSQDRAHVLHHDVQCVHRHHHTASCIVPTPLHLPTHGTCRTAHYVTTLSGPGATFAGQRPSSPSGHEPELPLLLPCAGGIWVVDARPSHTALTSTTTSIKAFVRCPVDALNGGRVWSLILPLWNWPQHPPPATPKGSSSRGEPMLACQLQLRQHSEFCH
jgi:hypothetical protein